MFGTNEIVGQKFFKDAPAESLYVTSMFFTLQGEGPYGGLPALFVRLTKCNLACSFCFVPCTQVTMADGTQKRIDQVKIGDMILSMNEDNGEFEPKRVTKTYQSITDKLVRVITNFGTVHCTPEHPFRTPHGWVNANELEVNDTIISYNKEYALHSRLVQEIQTLSPIEITNYNNIDLDECIVHNLEVEDNHTYIANSNVVHNCDTFFDAGDWMTFDELGEKMHNTICKYWEDRNLDIPQWAFSMNEGMDYPGIVLVITGGEPTLQKNLTAFLERQVPLFKGVQIESNGTVNLEIPEGVTLVCSPKCAEKNNVATKYLAPTKQILERADCLKFVMSADQNSPYAEVPSWAHEWKLKTGKEIYVSPMNIYNDLPHRAKLLRAGDKEITIEERSTVDEVISFWEPGLLNMPANQINHEYAAKYCMDYGFRLNLQVHLYASLA
jgi:7-carboxy-7-deazaguanine synthase